MGLLPCLIASEVGEDIVIWCSEIIAADFGGHLQDFGGRNSDVGGHNPGGVRRNRPLVRHRSAVADQADGTGG